MVAACCFTAGGGGACGCRCRGGAQPPRAPAPAAQISEHSSKIQDLQAAWQRAKTDEELNAGGAADIKRWGGIKVMVEARELLRSIFKAACDHKCDPGPRPPPLSLPACLPACLLSARWL